MKEDMGWYRILGAAIMFLYGLHGVWSGSIYLPSRTGDIVLQGVEMWVSFLGIAFFAASAVFFVLDEFHGFRTVMGLNANVAGEGAFLAGLLFFFLPIISNTLR